MSAARADVHGASAAAPNAKAPAANDSFDRLRVRLAFPSDGFKRAFH
jgi:hypothetical protein